MKILLEKDVPSFWARVGYGYGKWGNGFRYGFGNGYGAGYGDGYEKGYGGGRVFGKELNHEDFQSNTHNKVD